jgi:hypothetical protein
LSRILQEFQIVKKLSPLRTIFSETHKNTDDSGRRFGILLTVTMQESKGAGKAGGERERKKEAKAGEEGRRTKRAEPEGQAERQQRVETVRAGRSGGERRLLETSRDRGEVWTAGARKGRGRGHRKGTEEGYRENRGRLGGERLEEGKRRKDGT